MLADVSHSTNPLAGELVLDCKVVAIADRRLVIAARLVGDHQHGQREHRVLWCRERRRERARIASQRIAERPWRWGQGNLWAEWSDVRDAVVEDARLARVIE